MAVEVFLSYAHRDKSLVDELKKSLTRLRREKAIDLLYDEEIAPGVEWKQEIDKYLSKANIILLLISPEFMNSDYCYSVQLRRAMERQERGEARVIPILLRPVYWQAAPFSKLSVLPTNGNPITGPGWHSQDEAFFDVAEGIRKVIDELSASTKDVIEEQVNTPLTPKESTKERLSAKMAIDPQEAAYCQQVIDALTPSQLGVLQAFAKGMKPQEVSHALSISPATVQSSSTAILNMCRLAWNISFDLRLDYHFLQDKFGHYFDFNQ
jgi:TIR domain/Bacterial regulatory proteins, luxR family